MRMGVTLERVQNKFACIIGELCSEPDILSQFAIWLDLRLAEYKAKGAISLECSGSEPDPTWLRGHKGKGRRKPARQTTPARVHKYFRTGEEHYTVYGEYEEDQAVLSEGEQDDMAVMGARFSDSVTESATKSAVFPIHMYKVTSRKRPGTDSLVSEVDSLVPGERSFDHTPSRKSQRLAVQCADGDSSASLSDISGTTESLASIIRPDACVFGQPEQSHIPSSSEQSPIRKEKEPLQIIVKTEKPSLDGSPEMTETHVQLTDEDLSAYACPADFPSCAESSSSGGLPSSNRLTCNAGQQMSTVESDQHNVSKKETFTLDENVDLVDVEDSTELLDLRAVIQGEALSHRYDNLSTLQTTANTCPSVLPANQRTVLDGFIRHINSRKHQKFSAVVDVSDSVDGSLRDGINQGADENVYVSRGRKSRAWSQADMDQAVAAVESGLMSQRRACQLLGVPRTSLQRRLIGSLLREDKQL